MDEEEEVDSEGDGRGGRAALGVLLPYDEDKEVDEGGVEDERPEADSEP